jgi:uncharacterized protein YukE
MAKQTSFVLEDAETLLKQLQQFHETLQQEWSRVSNQWANLKSVWRDEQFDRFQPLFEQLSSTYQNADRECEGYIIFLHEQIQIAQEKQSRLGNLPG